MKLIHALSIATLSVSLLSLPMTASACSKEHREEMMKKYDANHDGVLDDAEKAAARKDRIAERKAKHQNHEGKKGECTKDASSEGGSSQSGSSTTTPL